MRATLCKLHYGRQLVRKARSPITSFIGVPCFLIKMCWKCAQRAAMTEREKTIKMFDACVAYPAFVWVIEFSVSRNQCVSHISPFCKSRRTDHKCKAKRKIKLCTNLSVGMPSRLQYQAKSNRQQSEKWLSDREEEREWRMKREKRRWMYQIKSWVVVLLQISGYKWSDKRPAYIKWCIDKRYVIFWLVAADLEQKRLNDESSAAYNVETIFITILAIRWIAKCIILLKPYSYWVLALCFQIAIFSFVLCVEFRFFHDRHLNSW